MMGFDGLFRPAQILPQTDSLNPYAAAHLARQDRLSTPRVKALDKDDGIHSLPEHQEQPSSDQDEEKHSGFSDEEAEEIRLMAKMRGILNFSLDSGTRYEFHINAVSGMVDLIAADTGECVLQLTPDEVIRFSEKIQRYAGMLLDRAG
jgi:uncharacterized FlaG/YvyC family protein